MDPSPQDVATQVAAVVADLRERYRSEERVARWELATQHGGRLRRRLAELELRRSLLDLAVGWAARPAPAGSTHPSLDLLAVLQRPCGDVPGEVPDSLP